MCLCCGFLRNQSSMRIEKIKRQNSMTRGGACNCCCCCCLRSSSASCSASSSKSGKSKYTKPLSDLSGSSVKFHKQQKKSNDGRKKGEKEQALDTIEVSARRRSIKQQESLPNVTSFVFVFFFSELSTFMDLFFEDSSSTFFGKQHEKRLLNGVPPLGYTS